MVDLHDKIPCRSKFRIAIKNEQYIWLRTFADNFKIVYDSHCTWALERRPLRRWTLEEDHWGVEPVVYD